MELLTGEQMRRIDRRTIEEIGIPGIDLMESAGLGVARALIEEYGAPMRRGVLVLCGKGANGGDGLVVARHLTAQGIEAQVLLLAHAGQLTGDAASQLAAARESGTTIHEVPDEPAWQAQRERLERVELVVDAILGTGVRGGPRGLPATVIRELNQRGSRVVSIDLPSGVDADGTTLDGVAVHAERTYTLCRPKIPLVLGAAARCSDSFRVIPIGIPDSAVDAEHVALSVTTADELRPLLPARDPDSHKGRFGHLCAIAGSRGKSGAAVLLGRAALRSGVGSITVATPASAQQTVAIQQAELMTEPLPESADGALAAEAAGSATRLLSGMTAAAIGPGLGTEGSTARTVRSIVTACPLPTVVDADGLNALALTGGAADLFRSSGRPVVLTPHPGEAARLLVTTTAEIQTDRVGAARRLSRESGAVVLLKGNRTLVATPDGAVAVNLTGNPGLATAGTGDVLTGILGALLARGLGAWDAARLAAYLHGAAGDLAAGELDPESLIASDVVDRLPGAIAQLRGARR